MKTNESPIQILDWDSNFFGSKIARIKCDNYTDSVASFIQKFSDENHIEYLEYLIGSNEIENIRSAERNGFQFIDIRMTLELSLNNEPHRNISNRFEFGLANEVHISDLTKIGSGIYKGSRYYSDGFFCEKKVTDFFNLWIEKAVTGKFDDECFSLFERGTPIALCTMKSGIKNLSSIGLFGVGAKHQGNGVSKELLFQISNAMRERGRSHISVVTQGKNIAAQRAYQAAGFKTKNVELWFRKILLET